MKYLILSVFLTLVFFSACKKGGENNIDPIVNQKDSIPADPATLPTQGFFMDTWTAKNFTAPGSFNSISVPTTTANVTVMVNTGQVISKMPHTFYGNNSNTWMGQMNEATSLMNHLNNFEPRIIRGPAGSVSDIFFFNANFGTPPADAPAKLLNSSGVSSDAGYWYGKNTPSWAMGIDAYYDILSKTNSVGMLTVNYGYARYGLSNDPVAAAAHLAADWVRYDKGKTKYWEIGNEVFGEWEAGFRIDTKNNQDGQPEIVTGALYGKHFKVFADSMRKAANEIGVTIKIGAVLFDSEPEGWMTNTIKTWNSGYFSEAGNTADFYSVHSYFTPYQENSTATTIFNSSTTVPNKVMTYVKKTMADAGVSQKPVAMTEWNMFCAGSKQNVSHIAGMHAVITIGEFIKNGYGASLRWDLANGWDNGNDHGLFSAGDEPDGVAKWNPRPAFFHMYYYQHYTGDRMLSSSVTGSSDVLAYASSFSSGQKGVVLVNRGTTAKTTQVNFQYFTPGNKFYFYTLTGGNDNGDFSRRVNINGIAPENGVAGGPLTYKSIKMNASETSSGIKVSLPARSVIFMVVDKK